MNLYYFCNYFPAPALSVSGSKGQNRAVYSQATKPPRFHLNYYSTIWIVVQQQKMSCFEFLHKKGGYNMATAKKLPSGSWRCRVYSHTEEVLLPDRSVKEKKIYKSFTCDDPSAKGKRKCEKMAAE